jgi:hypothetical protein
MRRGAAGNFVWFWGGWLRGGARAVSVYPKWHRGVTFGVRHCGIALILGWRRITLLAVG